MSKRLKLQLLCDGKVLFETLANDLPPELTIGRGATCAWRLPTELSLISREHARLLHEGGRVVVRDLGSRNGVQCRGTPITEKLLAAGDEIAIGDCLLRVEAVGAAGQAGAALLGRFGDLKGKRYALEKDVFVIGSGQEADLRIDSPMVSGRHAELRRGVDNAWSLRDLGSTNGTAVGGRRLERDEAVALRHGTRFYVAQYSFALDTGKLVAADKWPWFLLGLAAIAGAALLVILRLCLPGGGGWEAKALAAAGREQFDEALRWADKAVQAQAGRPGAAEAAALLQRITLWRDTQAAWQRGQAALATNGWAAAEPALASLTGRTEQAWQWNTNAATDLRASAVAAARLVRAWRHGTDSLEGGAQTEALVEAVAELDEALATLRQPVRPALSGLRDQAGALRGRLRQAVEEWGPIHAALEPATGSLAVAEARLDELAQRPGPHRERTHGQLAGVRQLRGAQAALDRATLALAALDGAGAEKQLAEAARLLTPPPGVTLHPALAAPRERLGQQVAALRAVNGGVVALAAAGGATALRQALATWTNQVALAAVLQWPGPGQVAPSLFREAPRDELDRYLGYENLTGFYMDVAGQTRLRARSTPFPTELERLDKLVGPAALLVQAADASAPSAPAGTLGTLAEAARRLLAVRTQVAADMTRAAATRSGRERLIAAAVALQVAPAADALTVEVDGKAQPLKTLARDWYAADGGLLAPK